MNPGSRKILLFSLCSFGLLCGNDFGQSSPQSTATAGQGGNSSANPTATQTTDSSSTATTHGKKKKVWTNEDVGDLNGPVSVVGSSKNVKGNGKTDGNADGQYIASTKKQLEKLQEQLNDTKKQVAALKDVQQGKAPEPAGYQLGKGYNRVPVDQQIASLEQKQRDIERKISDLLDEARKKGVLPGQLR